MHFSIFVSSGPDYLRDHRVKVEADHRNVGVGSRSTELSSEVNYLWRGAPNAPFPCSRGGRVGDIGWGIPFFSDWSLQRTGEQIMVGAAVVVLFVFTLYLIKIQARCSGHTLQLSELICPGK